MVEFTDTTYTAMVELWTDTNMGQDMQSTVESNTFIMGASFDEPPRLVKFTITPFGSSFVESAGYTVYSGSDPTTFWAIIAIDLTNYVIQACSIFNCN